MLITYSAENMRRGIMTLIKIMRKMVKVRMTVVIIRTNTNKLLQSILWPKMRVMNK